MMGSVGWNFGGEFCGKERISEVRRVGWSFGVVGGE